MTQVVCISDTHCQLGDFTIPDGDILIHAGDLTYRGNIQEITKELIKLGSLPHKTKLLIPGNHDWLIEHNPALFHTLCKENNIILLNHQAIEIDGIKYFGSGYTPAFCDWALNVYSSDKLKELWSQIPDDTQVLITHGPAKTILDSITPNKPPLGDAELLFRLSELKQLKLHVFGHIHGSAGTITIGDVIRVNASICTEKYKPRNSPIIVTI